ncbi:retrovirus-related Pol polyprotein from transposon 297 [Trichonephila clavipes]|nr:retrovirus-related Pol polyprotein from transposon 297 [Trichonephila clavipes]
MYGRDPKGPLSILKSIWTGNTLLPLNMKGSVESYLKKLKEKLEIATHKAKLTSDEQQGSYAKYYNRQKKHREFAPGDQVLVLIPDSTNKLYARWTSPVKIVKRVKPNSYYLQMAGAEKNDEALDRVTLDYLSKKQQTQLKDLLHRHRTLFSGKIKRAKVGEHVIKLKNEEETMKPKTYKIPENLKRKVDVQIDELLELGLIEPVVSEIAHPVVCVHKKDGTIRLCIDFRSLNALTVPDLYPMQNMMELNFLVGQKKIHYCTRYVERILVYTNGKQQQTSNSLPNSSRTVPMECVTTFGLRNAAATYQRAMYKVVQTISDFACASIDDLAIFSDTWEEYLNHLEEVFKRLEHFNFSVNLGKCEFARQKDKYLRHVIGSVYSELFAKIAPPLTELTKKKVPNEIPWNKEAEKAFKKLKTALCVITELQVPDIEKPYYLHTDASQTAVRCCLGQLDGEDNIHPIAFES